MGATAARPSSFAVFKNRNFALLWIGQFISTAGGGLTSIAASILVFRETGSAASVGLVMIATALPSLFVGLIAGVFVDRFDRKRIMMSAELIRAVMIGLIPLMLEVGLVWLYVLLVLSSAVGQFFEPAQSSVLPEVASDEELAAANSMMAISNVGALSLGFAAAGFLATRFSVEWAFYFDAVTFAVSSLCVAFVRIAPTVIDDRTNVATVIKNLRVGIGFVQANIQLRALFLLFIAVGLSFGLWNALILPFVTTTLDATEFQYGIFEGLSTVGFVLGSLAMATLADRLHEGQWIAISIAGMGAVGLGFGLSNMTWLALAFFILTGVLNAPSYIGRSLLIQRSTPREVRGRVTSAFVVTRDVAFMAGMAAAGLADLLNVRVMILACAVVLLVCGTVAAMVPGLGQPTAEWRRALSMLRTPREISPLGLGRAAVLADIDNLAVHLPVFGRMSASERRSLADQARVFDAPAGTMIVRANDPSTAAYFVLDGRTIANRDENGAERVLEVHNSGDFFGEIAALTGAPRTANVVAEQATTVLQVPAPVLRQMMTDSGLQRLFMTKMTERMARLDLLELPRMVGLNQEVLRDLRTRDAQPVTEEPPVVAPALTN